MTERPLVVILGAGRPFIGTEPPALTQTSGNQRILDWVVEAFEQELEDPEIHFVGGYQLKSIVQQYPEIHFSQNEEWENTGPIASLFSAPIQTGRSLYLCYGDTVFDSSAVAQLDADDDVSIAIDQSWQTRYDSRSIESLERAEKVATRDDRVVSIGSSLEVDSADGEFSGLVRFSSEITEKITSLWDQGAIDRDSTVPDLLRALHENEVVINFENINGNWAELETPEDLSRFVLDTKANTLRRLRSMVTESIVLDQYTFTVGEWRRTSSEICDEIADKYGHENVIVRSSALAEDSWERSNAGRFESILDVQANDRTVLSEAIERVIGSYPDDRDENQVLVQPMIEDPAQSGVVMTRSLDRGGPYYVINFDATTSSTESVTDGTGKHLQTAVVRKDAIERLGAEIPPTDERTEAHERQVSQQYPDELPLVSLLNAISELEELAGHDSLDIEFAIGEDETIYILQTRPMAMDPAEARESDQTIFEAVENARDEFVRSQNPPPTVVGDRTIYGVMPDWNPAEIIGRQPRRLAASLYRYLIMDETWARQRAEYGYRDVRPQPLMKQFAGQPYVDVRADFNSFIPDSVPDDLARRLVDHYLNQLEANPELHDKIEFEIALTCLPFDYENEIKPLLSDGFTKEELEPLREGLREITINAYHRSEEDLQAVDQLEHRFERIVESNLPPLRSAQSLLDDCKRFGTLPFAHLARTAFVATTLLRSLERKGVLTESQVSAFQNSLNTVAKEFEKDGHRVATGDLEWETFVDKYGHLRPGTYEITSASYKERPEEYLRPLVETATSVGEHTDPKEVWNHETKQEVERELERIGLPADAESFIEFLVTAIEGRERSKFVFSRNLSEALEQITIFGEEHGLSRDELSHIPVETLFEIIHDHPPEDIESWLTDHVKTGRKKHAITKAVELPPLLFEEADFLLFERPVREPNFVTNESVQERVVILNDDSENVTDVDGSIVMIPQADPGYDWLFGHDIAGLVTMYGGANSHMAVRAAEFSLPAAIGVGENEFKRLRQAKRIELNCGAKNIKKLS